MYVCVLKSCVITTFITSTTLVSSNYLVVFLATWYGSIARVVAAVRGVSSLLESLLLISFKTKAMADFSRFLEWTFATILHFSMDVVGAQVILTSAH